MPIVRYSVLIVLSGLLGIHAAGQPAPTEGALTVNVQTSSIESPLFETGYLSTITLFGFQQLPGGQRLSLFGSRSDPSTTPYLTLEMSQLNLFGGEARIAAGDVGTETPRVPRMSISSFSLPSLPVRGISSTWERGSSHAWATAGEQRFAVRLPGRRDAAPASKLLELGWMERVSRNHISGDAMIIDDPVYLDSEIDDSTAVLLTGTYVRELRPRFHLFGSATADDNGHLGGRAGAGGQFQNGRDQWCRVLDR